MATEAGGMWEMDAAAASMAEGVVGVGEMPGVAASEAGELARMGEVHDTAASMADGASGGDQSGVLNEQVCVESEGAGSGAGDVMIGTAWVRFGHDGFPQYFIDPNIVEPEIFGPDGPPTKFVVSGYTSDEVEAATALLMLRRAHPVLGIPVPTRPRTKMPRQRPRIPSAAELAALGFTVGSQVPEVTPGRRRRPRARSGKRRSDGGGRHGGKPGDGGGGGRKRATIIRPSWEPRRWTSLNS
jgi:hypothetical protein